jgi:colanic acid/amylovoran biosynthesis protein
VIGSRFHALIGALSQGVPSIGTSWSHKYERLFEDYHCQDMLLAVSAHKEQIRARIRTTTSDDRADLVQRIKQASRVIESSTKDMWRRVDRVIGLA